MEKLTAINLSLNEDTQVKEPVSIKEKSSLQESDIERTVEKGPDAILEEILGETDYFKYLLEKADDLIKSSEISLKKSRIERKAAESILNHNWRQ